MLLLGLYLFVFAPLISSKPAGISTANLKGKATIRYDQQDTSNLPTTINTCKAVILKFNITKPSFEVKEVISANFHIYRSSTSAKSANPDDVVLLFQIVHSQKWGLGAIATPQNVSTQGWNIFIITHTFRTWFRNGSTNHGLLLEATQAKKKVHPYHLGFAGFDSPEDKRPFIVVEFKKKSQNDEEKSNDNDDEEDKSNLQAPEKDSDEDDEEDKSNPQATEKDSDEDDEEDKSNPQATKKDSDEDDEEDKSNPQATEKDSDEDDEEDKSNLQAPEKDSDEGDKAPNKESGEEDNDST